jgi:hypothetical protein
MKTLKPKRFLMGALAAFFLTACATEFAAVGQTSTGQPVSGQLSGEFVDGKAALRVAIFSATQGACYGLAAKTRTMAITTQIPITCANGIVGSAIVTSDYLNGRDTIIYQVGGERGSIVTGLSTQVAG